MARLAFVITRFGPEIVGGAERLSLDMAQLLSKSHKVVVFTTTTSEMGNWNQVFPVGKFTVNDVEVHRFPISRNVSSSRFYSLHQRINNFEKLTSSEYADWVTHSGQSEVLFEELTRRQHEFDAIIFFQYLFGLTLKGCTLFPQKSILWPTAHEEGPLFTSPVYELFRNAKMVFWCTEGERKMVQRCLHLSPSGIVVGSPVKRGNLRVEHTITPSNSQKYILYAGRIENMKNVGLLLSYFARLKDDPDSMLRNLKLKLVGTNAMGIPSHGNIEVLGPVSRDELMKLYQHAVALCLPSYLESFSLVLMEAWLNQTPVLVYEKCDVTKQHCLDSNGGLFFQDFYEFRESVLFLLRYPHIAHKMGVLGESYVKQKYDPAVVGLNVQKALDLFLFKR